MRSRPARLSLSALAWIVIGAAAFLTIQIQQQMAWRRAALRTFEASTRDATDALGDAQAGQQAYLALGQDLREWVPKVAAYLQTAASSIDTLRTSAQSAGAGPSLLDATTALTQIRNLDVRLRQRISSESAADASAIVFTEAADAFSSALSNLDAALGSERQASDAFEATEQRLQVYALAGAAGLVAVIVAVLGFASPGVPHEDLSVEDADAAGETPSLRLRPLVPPAMANDLEHAAATTAASSDSAAVDPVLVGALQRAADVCMGFGRLRDASDLKPLLEQAATALNARGLIVWLGSTAGADLRPVLAHGYSEATLARIPTVARDANNAAASAYRTATLQVVKSRSGASQGALVAPLVGPDGCIGALTAEIRDRQEESEATRALAQIFASQLAGVLAAAAGDSAAGPTPAEASA